LVLSIGKPLMGRFLIHNSLDVDYQVVSIQKDPSCPLCSREPRIKGLTDYHDEDTITCEV
jgi:hypothetical protein